MRWVMVTPPREHLNDCQARPMKRSFFKEPARCMHRKLHRNRNLSVGADF
jgi:hypothetical protein